MHKIEDNTCNVINRFTPNAAAKLGYFYSEYYYKWSDLKNIYSDFKLKKSAFNIISLTRDNYIIFEDFSNKINFAKKPIEIYNNLYLLQNFSPSQAFYIGFLAAILENRFERSFKL